MRKFKNKIVAFTNRKNLNGCILTKTALKECTKNQYIPIFEDYTKPETLVGVTSKIEIKEDRLVIEGHLLDGVKTQGKFFSFGIYGHTKYYKKKDAYTLKKCVLSHFALRDNKEDVYREIRKRSKLNENR